MVLSRTRLVATLVGLLLLGCLLTGPAEAGGGAQEVMTNQTVIDMLGLGLGDAVLLEQLSSSRCDFDLSIAGLKSLKQAKASDAVIAAMMKATREQGHADAAASADPNDPASPHSPGIYLFEDLGERGPLMTKLEPTMFMQERSGGTWANALSYGLAKVKEKGVLSGNRAVIQAQILQPEFYFYFDVKQDSLSDSGAANWWRATSPNEFVLARVTIGKGGRELVMGQANAYNHQTGTQSKDMRHFAFERLGDGIYHVVPDPPLGPGEYCFYIGGGQGGGSGAKVFDFGVPYSATRVASTAEWRREAAPVGGEATK